MIPTAAALDEVIGMVSGCQKIHDLWLGCVATAPQPTTPRYPPPPPRPNRRPHHGARKHHGACLMAPASTMAPA